MAPRLRNNIADITDKKRESAGGKNVLQNNNSL
jgi:hypothetical protein